MIVERVLNDPRSTPGTRLGWPAQSVQADVIGFGQADFDSPVGHLTGADRALLYAFFNQRAHLGDLRGVLEQLFAGADRGGTPTILDLGCGPFTAGLALAAVLGNGRAFHYFGLDRSLEMRRLGATLAAAAREREALHDSTTIAFVDALEDVQFDKPRWDITLVVASYLLASPTIDTNALAASVAAAVNRRGCGTAAFLYLNSAKAFPNAKWPDLVASLATAGFELRIDQVENVRCALLVRRAQATWPIPGSK